MEVFMGTIETAHAHIVKDDSICGGRPSIRGTRIAVAEVAFRHRRGESVDEMIEAWPHLTPAQLYDALAYYYDHRVEVDQEVERSLDEEYWKRTYPPGKPIIA
jgi:uncharacterized protein (DUF433 family)